MLNLPQIIKYFIGFILLISIQFFMLDPWRLESYFMPLPYVWILLGLPFETSKYWVLIFAFLTGLTLDLLQLSLGFHTFACVMMAFVRPFLINLFANKEILQYAIQPHIKSMGVKRFLVLNGLLISIHHLSFFWVQDYSLQNWAMILFKTGINTIWTLLIIGVFNLIISSKKDGSITYH